MKDVKRIEMDAVDIEQLSDLLGILGVKEGFVNGEYHCEVCGETVTYDNTKFVFPKPNRNVGFVCKKASCFVEFILPQELSKEETT